MIEKMKFLSITGPKDDIDRVTKTYLSKYEIQLESALSELKTVKNLRPFVENNPYKDIYTTARELYNSLSDKSTSTNKSLTPDEAVSIISELSSKLDTLSSKKEDIKEHLQLLQSSLDKVIPYMGLNYDVNAILKFKYVRFRFGRISKEYFDKFEKYVYESLDTVLYKCQEDDDYVWAVYFVPDSVADKVDAIYASMHFERYFLPDEYSGTPTEAAEALKSQIKELQKQSDDIEKNVNAAVADKHDLLVMAYKTLEEYSANFDIRKLAACTNHDDHTFYILCGWMSDTDAAAFRKEIEDDDRTFCIVEDDHNNILSKPPTKLKNFLLFKPFEMYVEMYGLPAYNEFDPTILIALTYSFLFGFMFGDAGQGICLLIGGFLLYKFKKSRLAAIVSCCGFFSTIFGFMFGSVFGFEDIIEPVWLRPASAMTNLPFIGKLNTVFVVAIAIGMGIILMTMVLNIINSLRSKDNEKAWFDTNGLAGFVFYGCAVITIVLFMTGNPVPGGILMAVMFGLPLLVIFFKEPLAALVEKKAEILPKQKGMFVVQGFFEMFEVLLSYFSNTLSFVRVGAFAVSHAAMMEVVLMLAGVESGSTNWAVVVFGNIFVCGMEGLIVGIQVLRLEYYELFSRFYHGTGREFKPYSKKEA